jgi:hypothetical protein
MITTANARIADALVELSSVRRPPRPHIVWHSSPDSIAAKDFSVLAAVETVLAVLLYWLIALTSPKYLYYYPLTGIIVSPLLLLRSEASVKEGVQRAEAYVDRGLLNISGRPLGIWSHHFLFAIGIGMAAGAVSAFVIGHILNITSVDWFALLKGVFAAYLAAQLGPAVTIAVEPRYIGTIAGDRRLLVFGVIGGGAAIAVGLLTAGADILIGTAAFMTVGALGMLALLDAPSVVVSLRTERSQFGKLDSVRAAQAGLEIAPGAVGTFALSVFLGGWLRTVTIRFVATILHFWSGLKALPENWWRTLFVVDICQAPELIPGYRRDDFFNLRNFLARFKESNGLLEKYWSVLGFVTLYVPAYVYRIIIKSTFWLYMPLVYFSLPVKKADDLSVFLWNDPKEWWRRFLMVVTFAFYFAFNFVQLRLSLPEPARSLLRTIFVIDPNALKSWQIFSLLSALITFIIIICADRLRMSVKYARFDTTQAHSNEIFATFIVTLMRVRNLSTAGLLIVAVAYAVLWQPSLSNLLPQKMLDSMRVFVN